MPASRRALPALALAAIGLIGLGACGGSDLSKADYIAKVDPICAKYQAEADAVKPPTSEEGPALAGYYDQVAAVADRQVKEIDDAGRPKDGKKQIEDVLVRQRAQIEQIRQLSAALRAGDQPKAAQISAAAQPESDRIQSDLKAFGFTKCGTA
jgi:hypothetical protein